MASRTPTGNSPVLPSAEPVKRDRKRELVEIAYRLLAKNGLEGFRIRQVAGAAGIDNGTLHYHFPTKEALIHGVVSYLLEDLERNRAGQQAENNPLERLRNEFEDIRLRLQETPEQMIVLSELALRSWRDPAIAAAFKRLDEGWFAHLAGILGEGMRQGLFRKDLDRKLTAKTIMAMLRGVIHQPRASRQETHRLIDELFAQVEHWLRRV